MEVSVVKEGKHGILGLGADEAVVRVTLKEQPESSEPLTDAVIDTLEELLNLMGVEAGVNEQAPPTIQGEEISENAISVNIDGDDLGILIGRRGQTLACLQYIVRLIVGHQKESWVPIIVDVEGYKHRRYQSLQTFAQQMAEQVTARDMPFTFEPMPAYERRVIHMALANNPYVTTESIGQGESRRVVIVCNE